MQVPPYQVHAKVQRMLGSDAGTYRPTSRGRCKEWTPTGSSGAGIHYHPNMGGDRLWTMCRVYKVRIKVTTMQGVAGNICRCMRVEINKTNDRSESRTPNPTIVPFLWGEAPSSSAGVWRASFLTGKRSLSYIWNWPYYLWHVLIQLSYMILHIELLE